MKIQAYGIIKYQSLLKATAAKRPDGQDYKNKSYSITVLIKKTDKQCEFIQTEFDNAVKSKFPNGLPARARSAWKSETGELSDYMSLRSSSHADFDRPHVVNTDRQPLIDPSSIKIGDLVWVVGEFVAYTIGDGGINCYLKGTMITEKKGEIPLELLSPRESADVLFSKTPVSRSGSGSESGSRSEPESEPRSGSEPESEPESESTLPPAPPTPKPKSSPLRKMTEKCNGVTYDSFIGSGWTDDALIEYGYMTQ